MESGGHQNLPHETPTVLSLNIPASAVTIAAKTTNTQRSPNEYENAKTPHSGSAEGQQQQQAQVPIFLVATSRSSITVRPPSATVTDIPATPVTATPSLSANPKHLSPLPIKIAQRLTNTVMERLAREAAVKAFREQILRSRVPAPNWIEGPSAGTRQMIEMGASNTASLSPSAVSSVSPSPTAAALSPMAKRRKGKGIVTVINGLRQSLTAAGLLLFAGYTPSILRSTPGNSTPPLTPTRSSRSREGNRKSVNSTATRKSDASSSAVKWTEEEGAEFNSTTTRPLEDPTDDLMSRSPPSKKHAAKYAKNASITTNFLQSVRDAKGIVDWSLVPPHVTSAAPAPSVGVSRLCPTLKAVRLQQTLLAQEVPVALLYGDDGVNLAWVQHFIVDQIVYPLYSGAQVEDDNVHQHRHRHRTSSSASSALLSVPSSLSSYGRIMEGLSKTLAENNFTGHTMQSPRTGAVVLLSSPTVSRYPLLDLKLQYGLTVPIAFDTKTGRDIPLEVLEKAAAGDPIVLAKDASDFDDMGEHIVFGKRNLVDYYNWRTRVIGRWEKAVKGERGEVDEAAGKEAESVFSALPAADDQLMKRAQQRRRRKSHGHGPEAEDAEEEDEAYFGAIDSPRSALVCYKHGLRVASWNKLVPPEGIPLKEKHSSSSASHENRNRIGTPTKRSSTSPRNHHVTAGGNAGLQRSPRKRPSSPLHLSPLQLQTAKATIAAERTATDSLLPMVEDYRLLCRTITQKNAIYCMTVAAIDHMAARVPIPRTVGEVYNSLLANDHSSGGGPEYSGGLLSCVDGGAVEGGEGAVALSTEAQLSSLEARRQNEQESGRGESSEGATPSKSPNKRHSPRPSSSSLNHVSDEEYVKAPYGAPLVPWQAASKIISKRSPTRNQQLSPSHHQQNSSGNGAPDGDPSSTTAYTVLGGKRAQTPVADLLQRSHDDLLVEWGRRQQSLAHELYIDRRVAASVDKRRAERIAKARACQTPIQLRAAAEREARIQRRMARHAERSRRRRESIQNGGFSSGGGNGERAHGASLSSDDTWSDEDDEDAAMLSSPNSKRKKASHLKALNVADLSTATPRLSPAEAKRFMGTGAKVSRYHPNRYRPLLMSSSDEDEYSECSHESCSECEMNRRRRETRGSRSGRGGGGGGGKDAGEESFLRGGAGASSNFGVHCRPTTLTKKAGSVSIVLGGDRGTTSSPSQSPSSQQRKGGDGGVNSPSFPSSAAIVGIATEAGATSSSSNNNGVVFNFNPNASPSATFLEMQKLREQQRVERMVEKVHKKDAMAEEALVRKRDALDMKRSHNGKGASTAVKAEEVNARLERKVLFTKLLVAHKCQQQEHKDAQKKALAEERARQVSSEVKAKGALQSLSREVFGKAKVYVHKSLFLQEKLNNDYRKQNSRSEYHHHAQPQQQFGAAKDVSNSANATAALTSSKHAPLALPFSTTTPDASSPSPTKGGGRGGLSVASVANAALATMNGGSYSLPLPPASASSPLPLSPTRPHSQQQQQRAEEEGDGVSGGGGGGGHTGQHSSSNITLDAMFNQAIDARKAVSRKALGQHLAKERMIVKRWQQLEEQVQVNHHILKLKEQQQQKL